MKRFILGMISGLLVSGFVSSASNNTYVLKQSEYPIVMNCAEMEFENPVLEMDGTTYVPLREFCEKGEIKVYWKNYEPEHLLDWPPEHRPVSHIKLLAPFVQDRIQYATWEGDGTIFSSEMEKEVFVEKKYARLNKIQTPEEAIKLAATKLEPEYYNNPYDTNIYAAVYIEKYDAWFVMFNRAYVAPLENLCLPILEYDINAIISSDGEILFANVDGPALARAQMPDNVVAQLSEFLEQ